jgi:hypothetical protein
MMEGKQERQFLLIKWISAKTEEESKTGAQGLTDVFLQPRMFHQESHNSWESGDRRSGEDMPKTGRKMITTCLKLSHVLGI